MQAFLSTASIGSTALICKAFLNLGLCSISVHGLHNLTNALEVQGKRRGIVTVSNHISTLDDPLSWALALPMRYFFHNQARRVRWTLGAEDILFTNSFFAKFFTHGQVIRTVRGGGLAQPAVHRAIGLLEEGKWVHLFGEGKVNQPETYARTKNGDLVLPRFKWGVGRIISSSSPLFFPVWLSGFDRVMPEGRGPIAKYIPKLGQCLAVVIGEAIDVTSGLEMGLDAKEEVTRRVHVAVQALGRMYEREIRAD